MLIDKIAITVTAYNCLEFTKACLQSLSESEPDVKHHLILVDDKSTDGTKEFFAFLQDAFPHYVREVPEEERRTTGLTVITDPPTRCLAAVWNLSMEEAKKQGCQANLICNNDILFSPWTVDAIVDRFNRSTPDENLAMVTAHNLRDHIKYESILSLEKPKTPTESEGPDFSCFMLPLKVWEKMGHFDERFIPMYFEDNWTHAVLTLFGLKAIATTAAPYYHFGSKTQNAVAGGLCNSDLFEANRARFIEGMGYDTDQWRNHIDEIRERFGIVWNEETQSYERADATVS
jgi:GT2 family glycosyltransferase